MQSPPDSAAVARAYRRGALATVVMVEVDHPQGFGRFWSGVGTLEHGGETYTGFGTLVSIDAAVSSTEIEIVEVAMVLSGVDPDLVAGLDDSVKGRFAEIYEAILDDEYRVIERELMTRAKLDYQVFRIGADGKATIALKAHAGVFWLANRSAAKWGPEEARALHPQETGFDEIHLMEDRQDIWRPA